MASFLARFDTLEFGESAAREFGVIKAELRRAGKMIQDVDIQIAAIARTEGLILLTADGGFAHVPHLRTENWLRP